MKDTHPLVKIKDISTKIGSGATPKGGKESYKDSGISLIRSLNVYDYKLELKNLAKIDEHQAQKLRNVIVEKNDILLNITEASVARCTIVPDKILPARVNQHVSIIRIKKGVADAKYVLNTVNSNSFKNGLLNLAYTGATREALTKDDISNFKIPLPPLPIQKKIAAILSAYDELIENNNRRIAILEKMAEELYCEWFVRMRFPGHEKVKVVKGVPEGWELRSFSKLVFKNPPISCDKSEIKPYVGMEDLSVSSMIFTHKKYRQGNSGSKFQNNDILFPRITPSVENGKRGYVMNLKENQVGLGSTEFIVFREKVLVPEHIYFLTCTSEFRKHAELSMVGTSGRQRVQEDCFDSLLIKTPPTKELFKKFSNTTKPILSKIQSFFISNSLLRLSRDLLLPRLISGKLDVEKLDIVFPPGMSNTDPTEGKEAETA